MKRHLFHLIFCLVLLSSCHEARRNVSAVDWSGYRKAYNWLGKQRDSAFFYFSEVTTNSRDSLPIAMAYANMASIQSDAGDYYGAQESLSLSLKYLDTLDQSNADHLANDYNELGMSSADLKNYDAAVAFYRIALRYTKDSIHRSSTYNNIANAYQEQQKYPDAIPIYEQLLRESDGKSEAYARRLTNLATTRWLADRRYRAAPDLRKALSIREQKNDLWGLNSSYAHLADYYRQSHQDSAKIYAQKMLYIAQKLNSPDDELQALQKLTALAPDKEAKYYFKQYAELNDSVQTARNAAKNQFALIRYQVQKSKTDNLKLQKENSEKRDQMLGLILSVSVAVIVWLAWYRRRRKRIERETKLRIKENQLKTSKMVHDTVANDIYRIRKKIQYDPQPDKDWLLHSIDEVYQRSRDISYDIVRDNDENYDERISELLKTFSGEETKVIQVGNGKGFWDKISPQRRFELKYILQELMVNMQKHSKAQNVVIKFEQGENDCKISYFDDGIGLGAGAEPRNGMKNMGNRINEIEGEIIFENGSGGGLSVSISIPCQPNQSL